MKVNGELVLWCMIYHSSAISGYKKSIVFLPVAVVWWQMTVFLYLPFAQPEKMRMWDMQERREREDLKNKLTENSFSGYLKKTLRQIMLTNPLKSSSLGFEHVKTQLPRHTFLRSNILTNAFSVLHVQVDSQDHNTSRCREHTYTSALIWRLWRVQLAVMCQ